MNYDGVDNAIGGFSEIKCQLKAIESNRKEMKSTQDDIIQGQKRISTMVEKLLVYMESSGNVQRPRSQSKGHNEINDAKLGSLHGSMGVVRHCIW
jgi:hypothetical protein